MGILLRRAAGVQSHRSGDRGDPAKVAAREPGPVGGRVPNEQVHRTLPLTPPALASVAPHSMSPQGCSCCFPVGRVQGGPGCSSHSARAQSHDSKCPVSGPARAGKGVMLS